MKYDVMVLKISLVSIREQFEKAGKEGWELISIVHQPDATKGINKSVFSSYLAYFKKV